MAQKITLACRAGFDGVSNRFRVVGPIAVPASGLLVAALVSSIAATDDAGAAFWVGLMLAGGVVAMLLASIRPGVAHGVLNWTGSIVASVVVAGVLQNGFTRPDSVNPNWIASILVICAPFAGWYAVVCGVALLVCGSRGALLALLASTIALVCLRYIREGTMPRWFVAGAVFVVVAAAIAAIVARPGTVVDRFETWQAAIDLWRQRPLFGHGPGASMVLLGDNHADSLPLTVAMELGLFGLAFLVWLGVAVARMCLGKPGTPARLALLAFMLHQIVDATLYMPGVALLAGAALGVLLVHHHAVSEVV